MADHDLSGPYWDALHRGFRFANELGSTCGPAHFLVGIAEGVGPAAQALTTARGPALRTVVTADLGTLGRGALYLNGQAQAAALLFADTVGVPVTAEHLLVAVLDQGTAEVLAALQRAGIDPAAARRTALAGIGLAVDLPPITLPATTPAGTLDRPPLPVSELDSGALAMLRWRQEHLPLHRVRSRSTWQAMWSLEHSAAWRLGLKLGLDDDQRYSLVSHHADQVEQLMAGVRPDLVPAPPPTASGWLSYGVVRARAWPSRRVRRLLRFTVGWGTWFGNRGVGLRNRWFRLTTLRYYRAAPRP
jgi:hypothetical protein